MTPRVLRQMVEQYRERAARGEVTEQFLRGYVIAMFHAGAMEQEEAEALIAALPNSEEQG